MIKKDDMRILILLFLLSMSTVVMGQEKIRKHSFKTTFLSWATGSVKLFYEQSLGNNQTVEGALGYIGVMHDGKDNNPKGLLLRGSYKWNLAFTKEAEPLRGLYVKPEVMYSTFKYDNKETMSRERSSMVAVIAEVGYQWAYKGFVIDAFWGIGPAFGNEADTWYEHGFMLYDFFGARNKNVACSSGVKVGYAF